MQRILHPAAIQGRGGLMGFVPQPILQPVVFG
jgi:hypothetical protein